MKRVCFLFIVSAVFAGSAHAAQTGRVSMTAAFNAKPLSVQQVQSLQPAAAVPQVVASVSSVRYEDREEERASAAIIASEAKAAQNAKDRNTCETNGGGGTFVWASRNSGFGTKGVPHISGLLEDMTDSDNNTCWIRIDVVSSETKVDSSKLAAAYFPAGSNITCGSWLDKSAVEKAILNAKKSGRTWGTVAGVVGGAALGVGVMELGGNKLIGVTDKSEKLSSYRADQLAFEFKKLDPAGGAALESAVNELETACAELLAIPGQTLPAECN